MPEIWVPFGSVETLITLQAENLGAIVEQEAEQGTADSERLLEASKQASALFVCDSAPATLEVLRSVATSLPEESGLKVYASAPKKVEAGVAELKGKVITLPPPLRVGEDGGLTLPPELTGEGKKVLMSTARPDPFYGIVEARVQACLNWVAGSTVGAAGAAESMEPVPFQKTGAYDFMEAASEKVAEGAFYTVVPRGGRARAVMENPPFDAVRNGFREDSIPQARAVIVGVGGRGYDDTLSSAIRGVWNALPSVRRSGSVLLVAECHEGLGSTALEMLATGRMEGETGRKKGGQLEGREEIFYLNKLKQEYDVLLLSGLPETYARSRLGLTTARGSGEAVGRLLNKVGRSAKVNVVPRASECRISSA